MSPISLNQKNLSKLPLDIVKIPRYNRNDIKATIVHLGVGGDISITIL